MRKLILLGFTATLTLAAIGTWATAISRQTAKAPAAASVISINPLELTKTSSGNLPHEQYDAY
jgi:hypothetical protein